MTSSANSIWGEHKSTLNGCTGPLPGSPSSAHSGSCGVKEPAARPPPLSVRGLSGVGLTSAPHRTFADPAPLCPPTVPLLPLRILSSQMPPTPLACRPSPPLPSTDLGLAAGQPWDRVWQTCVLWGTCPRAASLSHVCHLLCPELPLGPLR